MTQGRFITLEGGEGVGKSTQTRLLAEALRARGHDVVVTREPGGTPGAEAIRELLLHRTHDWTAAAEALLFAAARADHVAKVIRPAIAAGRWVICDRFLDSSRAYQGGDEGISDDDLMEMHRIGSAGLLPDCTIMLEASPAIVRGRLTQRDGEESDRIGGRSAQYHAEVARRFQAFAAAETRRFCVVDAGGPPETVHAQVLDALADCLA